ncbi:DUF445 family protein [Intestinibacter bartlettii]|uniref:DUF445 family protein n=1 Tax=Intestinibacter bartlettii TaxID=261299 RepID=A0ABS6DW17_9FIRM|nr:DUF445 family protein [Intestinibacter bartlettii]MBU5336026.1 DUF445 family protein [Intestinibacter bartlettii]
MANVQDIVFILMQGFSGAVAGYITNKYAVNMIFKEYTPLKIGGAVKKNKVKFIEEVSELVEKDIINSETLIGSIESKDFSDVIDSACIDFMTNSLKDVFKGVKLKDIPGINISTQQCITFIEQNLQEELPKLIDNLSNKIDIKKLIQKDQLDNISEKIVELIIEILETDEKLDEFLLCLYDENKNETLGDFLSDKAKTDLIQGISNILIKSIDDIIEDEKKCLEFIERIYDLLDLKDIISKLEENLGQKTLEDIAGEEGLNNINNLLFNHIKNLINQDESRAKVKEVISELLTIAKDMDVTLFEILPSELANSIVSYIRFIIPDIAPHISNWLYENKDKIDFVINNAVEETINETDDQSIKGIVDKFGSMLSSISQNLKVVDRAANMVDKYDLTPEAGQKIYIAISKFFEETSIGDIVELLEDKLNLSDDEICEKLLNLFDDKGDILIQKIIFNFKQKSISSFINIDLEQIVKSKIIPLIYKFIRSNKDKTNDYISKLLEEKLNQILSNNIENLISKDKVGILSKKLPQFISKYIVNNKKICKLYIEKMVASTLNDIDFESIIMKNKESLILLACNKFNDLEKLVIDNLKDNEIQDVLDLIKDKEGFSLSLSQKLHKGLVNNVDKVIDNNVKRVIYNNLIKLDEDEICNIAQSFMGKQLKPLSYFGALLGTVAGLIFAFGINGTINNLGFYNRYQTTIMACVLMGLVGILTNVIALWMIFHPYEKNNFVAKIPVFRIFSQGYIPAHKEGFANGMAYFIDNELLKGKRVESLFNSKKDKFSESIFNFVSNNNFKMLVDIASEKKNKISKFLYQFVIDKCVQNKRKIAEALSKTTDNITLDNIVTREKTLSISQNFLSNLDRLDDVVIKFAQEKIDKQKTINELLPDRVVKSINNEVNEVIDNTVKNSVDKVLKEELIKSLVQNNSGFYSDFTSKTLGELLGEEKLSKLELSAVNNLNNYLVERLPSIIENSLDELLQSQLHKDKTIGEVFGGSIRITLDKNLYPITAALLGKLNYYAQENKEQVVKMVITMVRKQLNFFVKMAYDFMNGDHLVSLVVLNIIDTKLEDFINDTMYSTIKTTSVCLKSAIYPTTIQNIGFVAEQVNTKLIADTLVQDIKSNEIIFNNVENITLAAINEVKEIKMADILKETNIETVEGLYELLEEEIVQILNSIVYNYSNNIENINTFINGYVYENITSKVLEEKIENILNVDDSVSFIIKSILNKLNDSNQSRELLLKTIETAYENNIVGMKLNDVLDKEILISEIGIYLDRLFKDLDFNENNQYIVDKIVFNCIESEFKFIDESTKEYIIKGIVDALLTTGIGFTVDAMKALKLKEITTEQVEIMDPREIHMLFKAFAGDFFIKLYLYGSMGAVFGINMYLSVILGIVDYFYSKKVDEFEISTDNIFKE